MIFQKKQNPIHFIFRDYDDNPITEVWVSADRQTVKYQNYKYQNEPILTVFGMKQSPTWDDVLSFFERRCFPRERSDIKDILKSYTLSIPTKKSLSLSEGLAFPLTPPEQIHGSDREEIQDFLTTIRESMTEEKETEMELER